MYLCQQFGSRQAIRNETCGPVLPNESGQSLKTITASMVQDTDSRTIWNEAAKSGLGLGIFTGIFIYIGMLTGTLSSGGFGARLAGSLISVVLWIAKFIGCLWLLRFFMLKFALRHPGLSNRSSFRFGMLTALTSALIVAGIGLINMTVIAPDTIRQFTDAYMQTYSAAIPMGDSDRIAFERVMNYLPQISFFTTFIYCYLFGTIAAKIFSSSIPPKDVFGDPLDSLDNTEEDK